MDTDEIEEQDENEKLQLGEASTVKKCTQDTVRKMKGASCQYGVKRWGGKSNTWKTFDDAHASSAGLYKDDTFKPSATSLGSKYSFVKAWKRPTEM